MAKPVRKAKPPADDLPGLLKRLDAWFKKHRKTFYKGLRPGATAQELADLETALGFPVPDDLRVLLAWHNGQDDDSFASFVNDWRLMSTTQIAATRHDLAASGEKGWRPAFVPFLEDDRGDCMVLDTAAAGAPVYWWEGKDRVEPVADSLHDRMKKFVEAVEAGQYVEDPERGTFARTDNGP
jgi:cell wall assembly regulator SMI1